MKRHLWTYRFTRPLIYGIYSSFEFESIAFLKLFFRSSVSSAWEIDVSSRQRDINTKNILNSFRYMLLLIMQEWNKSILNYSENKNNNWQLSFTLHTRIMHKRKWNSKLEAESQQCLSPPLETKPTAKHKNHYISYTYIFVQIYPIYEYWIHNAYTLILYTCNV